MTPVLLAAVERGLSLDLCQGELPASHCDRARLHLVARSPHWPDLACQPCIYADLSSWAHTGARRWLLDCYLELADRARTQWSVSRTHPRRDSGAEEAAAFVAAAVPLLLASLDGRPVETPGQRRARAARRAWLADPGYLGSARDRLEAAHREAVARFYREHDWREFA